MYLSLRFLNDVQGVNSFNYAPGVEFFGGDNQTVFFQLIDASLDKSEQGFFPSGRRYVPAASSTLLVSLGNINDAKKMDRSATQPFAQDPSIWSFPILATDPLKGTVSIKLVLTEPTKKLNSSHMAGIFLRVL